jgi:hypothetical protein
VQELELALGVGVTGAGAGVTTAGLVSAGAGVGVTGAGAGVTTAGLVSAGAGATTFVAGAAGVPDASKEDFPVELENAICTPFTSNNALLKVDTFAYLFSFPPSHATSGFTSK